MLKYFLGVKIMRSKQGILLSKTKKLGVKSSSTPMTPIVHITKEGGLFEDPKRYRRLVGKLNYLTVTHSNIAYSVSVLSRNSQPLGNCRAYPMLFERSSWTCEIV